MASNQSSLPPDTGLSGDMPASLPYSMPCPSYPPQAGPVGAYDADQLQYPLCAPQVMQGVTNIFNSSEYADQPPASSSYPPAAGSLYPTAVGNCPPWGDQYPPMAGAVNVPYPPPETGCGVFTASQYNDNTTYVPAEQGYSSTAWIHASVPPDIEPSGGMEQGEHSGNVAAHLYCPEDCTAYAPGCQPAWAQKESIYLDKVSVWERPVESLQAFFQDGQGKGRGRLGVHHLAVFKLACGQSFTVEKIAKSTYSEILGCDHAKYTSGGPPANIRLRIMVDLKVASVPVQGFLAILKALGDKYKLLSNCWSYSSGAVKAAIKLCQKDANLSSTTGSFSGTN